MRAQPGSGRGGPFGSELGRHGSRGLSQGDVDPWSTRIPGICSGRRRSPLLLCRPMSSPRSLDRRACAQRRAGWELVQRRHTGSSGDAGEPSSEIFNRQADSKGRRASIQVKSLVCLNPRILAIIYTLTTGEVETVIEQRGEGQTRSLIRAASFSFRVNSPASNSTRPRRGYRRHHHTITPSPCRKAEIPPSIFPALLRSVFSFPQLHPSYRVQTD